MSPEDEDVEIVPVCTGLRGYASARGCIEIHGDLVIDDAPEDVQLPFLEKITGSLRDDRAATRVAATIAD